MEKTAEDRIKTMLPLLNEKQKRLYLAAEAKAIGFGGISQVSKVSGVSRVTIAHGMKENELGEANQGRCRKQGGGRKKIVEKYPDILDEIEKSIEAHTKGDPENPLKWTSKSVRKIEAALREKGYAVTYRTICDLLYKLGYSLQANRKELAQTESHPDRNEQFEYINEQARAFLQLKEPVISIDAKKKENIGNFKNAGAEYCKSKEAARVLDHDFPIKGQGKATPYGIYDVGKNSGFVNVGISHDTAEFAANSILRWWDIVGKVLYPGATKLMVTADCGGSNGYRVRLWKVKLQEIANKLGLAIQVTHFPPGTSKWNKIEHRLFSYISKNWRGKPLVELITIINLIASTTTEGGLTVQCVLDTNTYNRGSEISTEEFDKVNITPHYFHGEWNYTILPNL
jgi:transposase